ncbi:MAG: FGGY family carbohydrate kinase [Nitrososphaerota archaeon]
MYLLGADIGTTGCKTEIIDTEGNVLAFAYREYPLLYPRPYWVETDPNVWWNAFVETVNEVINKSKINPKDISGISVSGTNALVAVDKEGKPVRNAIMQLDKRSLPQAKLIEEMFGEEITEITGNKVVAGATWAPVILWIKDNEPELFNRIHKFLWPAGFIVFKLTNEYTMDWTRASWTCFFETKTRMKYSEKLLSEMNIPADKLPELYPSWKVVGEVVSNVIDKISLAKGIPVVAGMADTPAAGIGCGAVHPGDFFYILGTVGRAALILNQPSLDATFLNCVNAVPDTWMSMAVLDGGTICLRWFADSFGNIESSLAKYLNKSRYELLDEEASNAPPGSRGLIFFPYISGGRGNVVQEPNARSFFFGIGLNITRCEVIRAILEGVTYALRDNYEKMIKSYGLNINELIMCGGGSKSKIWRQIVASILNLRVLHVKREDVEPLGNAILAGFATGMFSSFKKAKEIVEISDITYPIAEHYQLYTEIFELYRKLYNDIKDKFNSLREISEKYFHLF